MALLGYRTSDVRYSQIFSRPLRSLSCVCQQETGHLAPIPTGGSRGSTFLLECCRKFLFMSSTESVSPDDVIVCACGTHEYTARDAIDAAIFRGELEEKWQTFLRHVAAEERADELELELDESAISAAAEEFRYRHDLITAEETEIMAGESRPYA